MLAANYGQIAGTGQRTSLLLRPGIKLGRKVGESLPCDCDLRMEGLNQYRTPFTERYRARLEPAAGGSTPHEQQRQYLLH